MKFTRLFMALIMTDERIAKPKFISTPGMSQIVKATKAPLTIRVKSPIVKITSGRERILTRGLTVVLSSEKIRPAVTKSQGSLGLWFEAKRLIQSHMPELDTSQCKIKWESNCLSIVLILAYFYFLSKYDKLLQNDELRHGFSGVAWVDARNLVMKFLEK